MPDSKPTQERPTWDEYFMTITREVAKRSTCTRRQVGALLVLDKRILATGYNGVPRGISHCADRGCLRDAHQVPSGQRHELCRGLHAEMNALLQAAQNGVRVSGATLYSTTHPCILCTKMLINCDIVRVVADNSYHDDLATEMLAEAGVRVDFMER